MIEPIIIRIYISIIHSHCIDSLLGKPVLTNTNGTCHVG